jgi:transcriptional regulator with XRE-family HTH domain
MAFSGEGRDMAHSFNDKLARLFEECRAPGGRRYANTEVVEAINAAGEAKLSPSYLSELLSGKKDNPSIWAVKALADFFGQPMDYFVEEEFEVVRPSEARHGVAGDTATTTLADRVNLLFSLAAESGTATPSNAQVAAALSRVGLTARRLSAVRAGKQTELPVETLTALADYFSVPPAVLTEDGVAAMVAAQLPAMRLMRDETVLRIAMRAQGLSEADRAIVTGLLDRLAREDSGISPDELTF